MHCILSMIVRDSVLPVATNLRTKSLSTVRRVGAEKETTIALNESKSSRFSAKICVNWSPSLSVGTRNRSLRDCPSADVATSWQWGQSAVNRFTKQIRALQAEQLTTIRNWPVGRGLSTSLIATCMQQSGMRNFDYYKIMTDSQTNKTRIAENKNKNQLYVERDRQILTTAEAGTHFPSSAGRFRSYSGVLCSDRL